MFDILIKNGLIADGSGTPAHIGDIAVADGKICEIADVIDKPAKEVIDAKDLVVSPGFIDNHTHSDTSAFKGSDCWNYLEQGVTTQIAGQCGSSPAPYAAGSSSTEGLPPEEAAIRIRKSRTPSAFMEAASQASIGTNIAFLIGQGSLRRNAMGYSDKKPTKAQMDVMKSHLKDAMDSGFLGMSTGLVYAPSAFADTDELIELSKIMAPYNGFYASHIRGEGDQVLKSVREAIRIGEESGVSVIISHLKVMGKHNEGTSQMLLKEIDDANNRGVRVYADQYPYTASSAEIVDQIPTKYLVGGVHGLIEKLKTDRRLRQEILYSIFHETDEFESGIYYAGFDGTLIISAACTPQYVNKTIGQIAAETGKEPIDVMCDLLVENDGVMSGIYFNQCASDLIHIMGHPKVFCCSDWWNTKRRDPEHVGGIHPRGTASMVRRLELVRDFRLRSMENSIRNLTYDTAQANGLEGRGLLKTGWAADICVFDYDKLHATADYIHPYRKNIGIRTVLVNGVVAVRDGNIVNIRSGKILKRGRL